jgi:hypothetical protein
MEDERAIAEAHSLFEAGAELVYLGVFEDRIWVGCELPDRPGVIVTARSIHEVRCFIRDVKLEKKL